MAAEISLSDYIEQAERNGLEHDGISPFDNGFVVVRCLDCTYSLCEGWRLMHRSLLTQCDDLVMWTPSSAAIS